MRYFIVKTDQHIIEPNNTLYGIDTRTPAIKFVDKILKEPVPIDFIVDTGDVADTIKDTNRLTAEATLDAYQHAKEILAPLASKTLYIPGNHDLPELMYKTLGDHWDKRSAGCMTKQYGEISLIGIDTRTGAEATAFLRPETEIAVDEALSKATKSILFTHYPWRTTDNGWIEKDGRVTNGQSFEKLLKKHKQKIISIFHGHLHAWWFGSCCGIPVHCATGSALGFHTEPQGDKIEKYFDAPLGYFLVAVDDSDNLLVRARFI